MPRYINDEDYDDLHILQKKIFNVPWWISYKLGITPSAKLQDRLERLAGELGISKSWLHKLLEYVITQFTLRFKDKDYYGYHTLDHELESAYISLLAAKNDPKMSYKDCLYLLVAALLHDMDPHKQSDKPHENSIEQYIRNEPILNKLIKEGGLDIDIIIAMIYRTIYPFKDKSAEVAMNNINRVLGEMPNKEHYINLGWFLSICERIAGYTLGDFKRAVELAIRNAHALNWHPSVINRESVRFFEQLLNEERPMFDRVITNLPKDYSNTFLANVAKFNEEWNKEREIRNSILINKITLFTKVEDINKLDILTRDCIVKLYDLLPLHLRLRTSHTQKLLYNTVLITLHTNEKNNPIVGYAKGGPLEYYRLRANTIDTNLGKYNTIYLEPMIVMPGYWDGGGGKMLRRAFLSEASKRSYEYLTSYNHRKVLEYRIEKGEPLEIVCKFDPDMLDYYRIDLKKFRDQGLI